MNKIDPIGYKKPGNDVDDILSGIFPTKKESLTLARKEFKSEHCQAAFYRGARETVKEVKKRMGVK